MDALKKYSGLILAMITIIVVTYLTVQSCNNPHRIPPSSAGSHSTIRIVHNTCANVWAVQKKREDETGGRITYFGESHSTTTILLIDEHHHIRPVTNDTTDDAGLGEEFQFPDSLTASRTYTDYWVRRRKVSVADSLAAIEAVNKKRIEDSIFNCKHSYQ